MKLFELTSLGIGQFTGRKDGVECAKLDTLRCTVVNARFAFALQDKEIVSLTFTMAYEQIANEQVV
jgi:hypothetical protein